MIYESSYETGRSPFVTNLKRGYWSSANDFIYAGLSFGFRLDVFALSWMATVETGVSGFLPSYLASMVFFVIPLLVVKSFMGQFSNSGFISAMRLCPLFKGIGYVTLFLNVCVLIYYSVFVTIPLVYLIASFNPTLPWSCDGVKKWTTSKVLLCHDDPCESRLYGICYPSKLGSLLYFLELFENYNILNFHFTISRQLVASVLCVWSLIFLVFYTISSAEKMGQLIRYASWCTITLLLLFIIRFSFLPGSLAHYQRIFNPNWRDFAMEMLKMPVYGMCAFGPGWGLFITLASFNKFKTNITRSSCLIGIGQMFIIFGLDMLEKFINLYVKELSNNNFDHESTQFGTLFITSGSVLATLEWPNLWSILFYFMLFLSSLALMILQLYSILTAIFDEFVWLRQHRKCTSFCLISTITVFSLYFATETAYERSVFLIWDTIASQSFINLLLLIMVTSIYGIKRFQRDMLFMNNQRFARWKIYMLIYFAPLCLIAVIISSFYFALRNADFHINGLIQYDVLFKTIPWWSIPAYMIYSLYKSQGTLKERFIKCCRPTDWYPLAAEDRLHYEEDVNNSNMTHPLTEFESVAAVDEEEEAQQKNSFAGSSLVREEVRYLRLTDKPYNSTVYN